MRLLFCNFEYPPLGGGGGVITSYLAQELAKRHEVTVLTSAAFGLPPEREEQGVQVVRAPIFFRQQKDVATILSMLAFLPLGTRAGKKILNDKRYDLINTHFVIPSGPVGDALARHAGIPNALTVIGGDIYDPSKITSPHHNPFLRVWIRQLLRRADIVTGDSANILDNMRRFYTPEIEGVRIPLAIQRPDPGVADRSRYGCSEDETLLVTIGRLVARKAVIQLIAMMEAFRNQKVRLLVIGSGPQEQMLKSEALKRELSEQVLFLGAIWGPEKFHIVRMCDLYVSASQHEGFGLVFLEGMACGLPVVCYDHGGQTDFLADEETGYLVPLNNLELFTERCRLLIGNPRLRKAIGESSRERVEEFYIDRVAAAYERVFFQALGVKSRGDRLQSVQPLKAQGKS